MDDFRLTSSDLGFTLVGKTKALTNPRRHFHPWWEILYIVSGERIFFYGNKTVQAKAGAFIIVAPGVLHRAINAEGEICSLYNIFFDDDSHAPFSKNPHSAEIINILKGMNILIQFDGEAQKKISALFERLEDELSRRQKNFEPLAWSLLTGILVYASRRNLESRAESLPAFVMNERFSQVIEWVNSHFADDLNLPETASKFNMTASHLSRLFKEFTDFTFVEYVNSLRIAKSCELLKNTNDTTLDIAFSCGFGSVTQFDRWFKKLTGKSPHKYRTQKI